MSTASSSVVSHARGLIKFIDKSPTPFHAVAAVKESLLSKGFREIQEHEEWNLKPNDLVFITRNYSTIVAMAIGGQYKPGNGFSIIGAHTDSPCLKLKPWSDQTSHGYTKLGVETYGGGIWHTWFDRDLTVAGRCIVRDQDKYRHCLINLEKPIARVPSLAIHLDREVNEKFSPNKEFHLTPLISTNAFDCHSNDESCHDGHHHPRALVSIIASKLNVKVEDIVEMELSLADTQPSSLGGINDEFIFAPRLDNLFNCYAAIEALLESLGSVSSDSNIRLVCLYDNEEVGSMSAQGAHSAFTELVLRRVVDSICYTCDVASRCNYERAIGNSFLVSADQAHAVHPNYDEKHEKNHRPLPHKGIVLKINSNQRYASTGLTTAIMKEIAKHGQVPLQEFVVRQDVACGSTIGPILASCMSLATVDVGGPQLSMHSCREMTDVSSSEHAVRLFKTFFELYPDISSRFHLGQC